jgi:hypothetical protein
VQRAPDLEEALRTHPGQREIDGEKREIAPFPGEPIELVRRRLAGGELQDRVVQTEAPGERRDYGGPRIVIGVDDEDHRAAASIRRGGLRLTIQIATI